jgi:CBS domain containing-hemolysin-like protein
MATTWFTDVGWIALAAILVLVNGFFVAAEFALVRVRPGRLETLVRQHRPLAGTAMWLVDHLDGSLSACQVGITLASLGLGWVGEPAVARLLTPVFHQVGVDSPHVVHGLSFAVAFTGISAAHLVIGEQAPKMFAIRKPETMALWVALPLRGFYFFVYPFIHALNHASLMLVRWFGGERGGEQSAYHSEEELRALLTQAHVHGELTRSEHKLLNAVFEFDDLVCRRVMLPRGDVIFLNVDAPVEESLEVVRRTKHTRYPLCRGSLDAVLGVVHIKDMLCTPPDQPPDLQALMRPPHHVPETMPISKLLRHFQATRQHMAFVVDEYGTVVGIVTLENILEQIVGPVEDEFDAVTPEIVPVGSGQYIVLGRTPIELVEQKLGLELETDEADTISGLLVEKLGRLLQAGDSVELNGALAEVLEVKGARARRIRLTPVTGPPGAQSEVKP